MTGPPPTLARFKTGRSPGFLRVDARMARWADTRYQVEMGLLAAPSISAYTPESCAPWRCEVPRRMNAARHYFRNIYDTVRTIAIGMRITLKYCFARTVTVQYPDRPPTI